MTEMELLRKHASWIRQSHMERSADIVSIENKIKDFERDLLIEKSMQIGLQKMMDDLNAPQIAEESPSENLKQLQKENKELLRQVNNLKAKIK